MRSWIALSVFALAGVGCHSSTAPTTTLQTWNYQASALTNGPVTCTFGAALALTDTVGTFTGTFQNGYMACSGPNGASSTLVSGTVDSGAFTGSAMVFQLTNTDVTNSGEVSEATISFTNSGTISQYTMTGTATANITLGGQTYVVTGPWQASFQ